MSNLPPIPKVGQLYWFYENDQVKLDTEFQAKVIDVYTYDDATEKFIYKYDDALEEIVAYPIVDLWLEEAMDLFWILSEKTDYIIRTEIPKLCPQDVFFARTVDGEWHTFETASPRQFGILDVTGELYNRLHSK